MYFDFTIFISIYQIDVGSLMPFQCFIFL